MAKYYGRIGFCFVHEDVPGIFREKIRERKYTGDVYQCVRQTQAGIGVNDDMSVANEISVVGDAYLFANFYTIRYAEWMKVRWKVTKVKVEYPRLRLTLGGVYSGETPEPPETA